MTVHIIFQECSKYTLDKYWKDLLIACSTNKFPKGVKYDSLKGVIYVRTFEGKSEMLSIPDDSKKLFTLMMRVFKTMLRLISPTELQHKKDDMKEALVISSIEDSEWKEISKSKASKSALIGNYVVYLSKKYNLTLKQSRTVFSAINLGIQFKKINPEDIELREGKIVNIKGMDFDPKSKEFIIPSEGKPMSKSSKTVKVKDLYKKLDLYLKECHKLKTV